MQAARTHTSPASLSLQGAPPDRCRARKPPSHHICTALGLPCPLACMQSEASWEVVPERMASGPVT